MKAVVVTTAATRVPAAVSLIEYLLYFKILYMLWVIITSISARKTLLYIFSYLHSTLIDRVI